MTDLTPEERDAKREARRERRRRQRIANAHARAAHFSVDSLTSSERQALEERDFLVHGVETDEEGFVYVALAKRSDGARLEALGTTPQDAVARLVSLATR